MFYSKSENNWVALVGVKLLDQGGFMKDTCTDLFSIQNSTLFFDATYIPELA